MTKRNLSMEGPKSLEQHMWEESEIIRYKTKFYHATIETTTVKRKRYSKIPLSNLKAKKSSYETNIRCTHAKCRGGYACFRSFRLDTFGIRRKDALLSLKVLNNLEMNPKRLALDTIVNIVDHEPPTHETNEEQNEIVMDAAVNVDMFEDGIGENRKVRYRRSKNSITEEFDPVMKISKTTIRATPMAISVASDSVMRLLKRIGVNHNDLGDDEEGVHSSGTTHVISDSHGTPLPLAVFGVDEDDSNYWAVRSIDVEDNVTISYGHSVEVVSSTYCFMNDVNA